MLPPPPQISSAALSRKLTEGWFLPHLWREFPVKLSGLGATSLTVFHFSRPAVLPSIMSYERQAKVIGGVPAKHGTKL